MEITKEIIDIATPDGDMALVTAKPVGTKPHSAIIVIMEAFGLDPHIVTITERFANAGFFAVAPDLFHRSGRLRFATYDKLQEMREDLRQGFSDQSIDTDIQQTINFLHNREDVTSNIGIVGFCLGGRISLQSALRAKGLAGAAIFYGGNMFPSQDTKGAFSAEIEADQLEIPIIGFFGVEDQNPTITQVQGLENKLMSLGKVCNFNYYENAGHGFFCEERESFRPDSAKDAWAKTLDFFNTYCP